MQSVADVAGIIYFHSRISKSSSSRDEVIGTIDICLLVVNTNRFNLGFFKWPYLNVFDEKRTHKVIYTRGICL